MSELEATNPVAEEPVDGLEETGVVEAPEGDSEQQLDDDGNPVGTDDDDSEELDVDGQKVKLPKDIAATLKARQMMHADYTRKTQEIAEQRKALDAERTQAGVEDKEATELRATVVAEERRLTALDTEIAKYRAVTSDQWAAWKAQDPVAADRALFEYQNLRETRTEVAQAIQNGKTSLSEKMTRAVEAQRGILAKRIEERNAVLARDIKGWGPDLVTKLTSFGATLGFTEADAALFHDARNVKLLHAAYVGTQAAKTKQVTAQVQKTETVRPTPKIGNAPAPVKGLDDRLSTAEWTRRRNAEVATKRR